MSADFNAPPIADERDGTPRSALRRRMLAERMALPNEDCARLSAAICAQLQTHFAHLAALRVGFYWPINKEPDLRPLIEAWIAAGDPGFAALLPVVEGRGQALVFHKWDPHGKLAPDACGILAPAAGDEQTPQALLIPVNAFDAAGYRLGYGGGFFDRTLAALDPQPLAIGVGFEIARVASIAPQPHDMKLAAVVTEAGVFRSP